MQVEHDDAKAPITKMIEVLEEAGDPSTPGRHPFEMPDAAPEAAAAVRYGRNVGALVKPARRCNPPKG